MADNSGDSGQTDNAGTTDVNKKLQASLSLTTFSAPATTVKYTLAGGAPYMGAKGELKKSFAQQNSPPQGEATKAFYGPDQQSSQSGPPAEKQQPQPQPQPEQQPELKVSEPPKQYTRNTGPLDPGTSLAELKAMRKNSQTKENLEGWGNVERQMPDGSSVTNFEILASCKAHRNEFNARVCGDISQQYKNITGFYAQNATDVSKPETSGPGDKPVSTWLRNSRRDLSSSVREGLFGMAKGHSDEAAAELVKRLGGGMSREQWIGVGEPVGPGN